VTWEYVLLKIPFPSGGGEAARSLRNAGDRRPGAGEATIREEDIGMPILMVPILREPLFLAAGVFLQEKYMTHPQHSALVVAPLQRAECAPPPTGGDHLPCGKKNWGVAKIQGFYI